MYKTKTVTENYLPADLRSYYESAFVEKSDKFKLFWSGNSPFVLQDAATITDCVLKKISIPVFQTEAADKNGKLVFTLLVHDRSLAGLRQAEKRKYEIKIDPADYGLTANTKNVMKYVDIDLAEYDVMLLEGETLAMFAATDTIVPMQAAADDGGVINEAVKAMADSRPEGQGYFFNVGTKDMSFYGASIVPVDFEWEKTYSPEAQKAAADAEREYKELAALLKEKYSGKNVSVLGDSISTFKGVGDNAEHNSAIYDNLMYYSHASSPYKWEDTYWGRLVTDLDMNLCVANGWGSGRVYGRHNGQDSSGGYTKILNFRDSAPERATQLHRNDGTSPDLILMYMGINDLHNNGVFGKTPFGGLYDILKNADPCQYDTLISSWFSDVLIKTSNATKLLDSNNKPTYADFEEAYALALYRIKERYPNAEVLCLGLVNNASVLFTVEKQQRFNLVIKVLAEYFGYTYVDQMGAYSEITTENMHFYTMDIGCVHPDALGHAAIERMIMRYLADKVKNG